MFRRIAPTLVVSLFLLPAIGYAQWTLNGTPVSTGVGDQRNPAVISDGAGGVIIAFEDQRSGNSNIYAQRFNALGVPLWAANGVALCSAVDGQISPRMDTDGAGGAIVAWYDHRSGTNWDIYARRVDAAGNVLWTPDGVAICTAANDQYTPRVVSDGAGGALIAWEDYRTPANENPYVQRVNSAGTVLWPANGVAICSAANGQVSLAMTTDGANGAIVAWADFRSGVRNDIYARRINSAGAPQWTVDGVAVCAIVAGDTWEPDIMSDGAGGAILAWWDHRNGVDWDIYAGRVTSAGATPWTAGGVPVCTQALGQYSPHLVTDGAGGAIIAWSDYRGGANADIYARRVDASGGVLWPLDGVALCTAANDQYDQHLVSDGAGGAIVAWADGRNGPGDMFAQRVDGSGNSLWAANGTALCIAPDDQSLSAVAPDGKGGAIVAWSDFRSGSYDIYAQRVEPRYGFWGVAEPRITSVADVPHDQGGHVAVNWKASDHDRLGTPDVTEYSVWRAVDPVAAAAMIESGSAVVIRDPARVHDAQSQHELIVQADYYWERVAIQDAFALPGYSYSASTRADSVAGSAANHVFMVMAHAGAASFPSAAVAGHSVDNLAPAAPLLLTAQRVGSNVNLRWNGVHVPDLKDYSVYRKTSAGVTPVPVNFLAASNDTVLVDTGAPTSALYYIVTAKDVHANQGPPSNEASVQATTGVGNTPPITALTVLQNQPNPFTGTTDLRVGLPASADLSIEVYDVAGRRVRAQTLAHQDAGWRTIPFDGRDDSGHALASGVYFYRVSASGKTVTNKMVIAR